MIGIYSKILAEEQSVSLNELLRSQHQLLRFPKSASPVYAFYSEAGFEKIPWMIE